MSCPACPNMPGHDMTKHALLVLGVLFASEHLATYVRINTNGRRSQVKPLPELMPSDMPGGPTDLVQEEAVVALHNRDLHTNLVADNQGVIPGPLQHFPNGPARDDRI